VRCAAITKGGSRCRLDATLGGYCYQHSPETEKERRRNASRGGRAGGNGRRSGTAEIESIKAAIRAVLEGVADGTVEHGAVVFMGYNTLLRAVDIGRKIKEQDDLAARITELEGYAEHRVGRGGAWRA
jgi:hypothetical protein